ncbi:MAG: cobalamin-dependent protein [Thermodesulfobacteriota bacterium]|nr:cobalamin-dependent protein [Thermodesulfobacteriota bacterium]
MTAPALRPIRRVMLIFPPMHDVRVIDTMVCPPMGIACLGAYIRDIVSVRLLDCLAEGYRTKVPVNDEVDRVGISYDRILEIIRAERPDMVGISCIFSSQIACLREISRRIKTEIDEDIVVVTGGTHPSFLPEQTLAETRVDYVVLGEGELGLRALIEAHNGKGRIEEIDGIACRQDGDFIARPRSSWIEDLDSLPFPARDLLPMETYFKAGMPMAFHWRRLRNVPIVSSRGCPYRCKFCSSYLHWGKRFRKRSPESVLAEIEHLRDAFDVQELKWQDDNLTADRKRARAIFQGMIDRGLAMPWNTPNGVAIWTLDDEMLGLMKQSGCYEITLAVESGDPESFKKYVGKPFDLEKPVEIARLCRRHGIATAAYFIVGFPGETLDQIKNSMRYALRLKVDYLSPFVYTPLPGSDLWRQCVEEGIVSVDYAYEDANNFFKPDFETPFFDIDEVYRIQGRAYLLNLLKLPFRNPREFFAWYGRRLVFHPVFIYDFFRNIWKYRKQVFARVRTGIEKTTRSGPAARKEKKKRKA